MDQLLEKIQKFGKNSLTDEEQRFLKRVADRVQEQALIAACGLAFAGPARTLSRKRLDVGPPP